MSSISPNGHVKSLNLLRGVAALSVYAFHFLSNVESTFFKTIFSYGHLGLGLFFIISGFIIPYSMHSNTYELKKFPKFILKRSIRIEPPYIISFILIIFMRILHLKIHNWQDPGDPWEYIHNWKQFALHFFYLNQYFGYESYTAVYWTLAIEFQFYILIGFLYPLVVHANKIAPILLFVVFSTAIWFLNLHYNWFILQYGYLFICGILIFLFTVKHISFRIFLVFLSIVLYLAYYKNGIDVFFLMICATIAIITIKHEWAFTNFFGKISYSFYLTHMEAGGWFLLFFGHYFTTGWTSNLATFCVILTVAILFYYLFEKPALYLSKRLKY